MIQSQVSTLIPQDQTERLLAEALIEKKGAVEYATTFVSAEQHDDYVSVTLEQKGAQERLKTAYVVGCDGAHSAVRHHLDLPFDGAQYKASFMLADVETNDVLPADEFQLCPSVDGPLAIFPMSATRRRIVATVKETEGDVPSMELTRRLLNERAPQEIEAKSLFWSSYFFYPLQKKVLCWNWQITGIRNSITGPLYATLMLHISMVLTAIIIRALFLPKY